MYRVEDSTGWRGVPCVAQAQSDILKNGFPYDFHKKKRAAKAWKNEGQTILLTKNEVSPKNEKTCPIGM